MTPRPTPSKASGFTLVELLVTIAIAGVLLGVAIPSFREVINNNRLTTQANTFLSALTLARSEAVKRGVNVTVLQKSTTDGDWHEGWDIFVDRNADGALDDDGDGVLDDDEDIIIRHFDALPTGMTLITTKTVFVFEGSGFLSGVSNSTVNLCADDTTDSYREIAISKTGRARISEKTGSCPN